MEEGKEGRAAGRKEERNTGILANYLWNAQSKPDLGPSENQVGRPVKQQGEYKVNEMS